MILGCPLRTFIGRGLRTHTTRLTRPNPALQVSEIDAAKCLVEESVRRGSKDNLTAMVVFF